MRHLNYIMKTGIKHGFSFCILLFLIFYISINTGALAQDDGTSFKILEAKKAFLVEKLKLTKDEEAKFWPAFNDFDAERKKIKLQIRHIRIQSQDSTVNDTQLKNNLTTLLQLRQQELDLEKKYLTRFLTALPPRKVTQVLLIEKEFLRELYKNVSQKSHHHHHNNIGNR